MREEQDVWHAFSFPIYVVQSDFDDSLRAADEEWDQIESG